MRNGKRKIKNISERRIADVLISYLRSENHVTREVRHYEKSIDLVSMGFDCNDLCAVEVKTQNWKKAFQQAFVNLAVAEKSYIAMYSKYVGRVDVGMLKKHGIGLYSVGTSWGDVELLEDAQLSLYTNRITNRRIKDKLFGAKDQCIST